MVVYIIISFFLENIVGLLINNIYIIPLFFLVSLIIYYQVMKPELDKYLLYLICLGLLYDVIYTNIYVNPLLFFLIGIISYLYNKYFKNNFIFIIFILFIYEFMYYMLYVLLGLNNFNILIFIKALLSVLPINIAYYYLSYLFIKKLGR